MPRDDAGVPLDGDVLPLPLPVELSLSRTDGSPVVEGGQGGGGAEVSGGSSDDPLAGLNARERRFVLAYIEHPNLGRAAEVAGYSSQRPRQQGYLLMNRPEIRRAVDRLTSAVTPATDELLLQLARQATARLRDVCVQDSETGEWRFDLGAAIERGTDGLIKKLVTTRHGVQVELHDPQRAAELILRVRGAFLDRLQVSVRPEQLAEMSDEELAALADGKPRP